jgi:hypothetical protein
MLIRIEVSVAGHASYETTLEQFIVDEGDYMTPADVARLSSMTVGDLVRIDTGGPVIRVRRVE